MSTKALRCPNCGAEVEFSSPDTLVVVCAHCAYASFRTDVALESIGQVAMPAELESHFRLGTRGRLEGEGFEVCGQLQLDHGAGPWNEWCARTERGAWLWIVEAQGRVSVMRETDEAGLPPRAELEVGSEVELDRGAPFVVTELGTGRVTSAAGELPVALALNASTSYADLSRAGGGCATIDWTLEEPSAFVGRFVDVSELALDPATQPEKRPRRVGAKRVACKNCGAAIELLDPANALTVACASCLTLLEPTAEGLVARQAQKKLQSEPRIRLGLTTKLRGEDVQVLGFLRRAVRAEGLTYPWSEYLLRTAGGEYRWLVENNGHWLLATPIDGGAVKVARSSVSWQGERFRHFDGGMAEVLAVLGEFYWQVRVGDKVSVNDYVAGGRMLSVERDEKELVASTSVHLEPAEVARAFQLAKAVSQRGVGPLQPNPYRVASAFLVSGLGLALVTVLFVIHLARAENRVALNGDFGPTPASAADEKVDFSEPFELTAARGNLRVELSTLRLDNGWLGVDGALVSETTGAVTSFAVAAEYYHGISDGESWSEGSGRDSAWIGNVPAGRYRLRLAAAGYDAGLGHPYHIRAISDVPRWLYFVLAVLALLALPVGVSLLAGLFEKRRWDTSAHPWGESA